ncbi:MAG TPA: hypothetical protein VKB67_02010 [Rhizomicrobium sp.]|nr:hypothetical protein [Rhizomicrobium sp.]
MSWLTFGNAVSPEPMSALDTQFTNVATGMSLPCTATGTNAISLTPLTSFPALLAYTELGGYRFVAAGNSTAPVTLQYNGLGLLPVYHADGTTQASTADLVAGEQYIATFHQALNSGSGGFYLESPSVPVSGTTSWFTPGGRMSLQNGVPVMTSNQTAVQTIFYPPYQHPWVPLYNGSTVQMVQFAFPLSNVAGQSLSMGGAANFPSGANFDLFMYSNAGTPNLCAIQWTNTTTRATTLSVFAGFLTNSGAATAQTGPNTSFTLPINQGTFLGSFNCSAQGASQYVFGASASGGTAGSFLVCNYYNKVMVTSIVTDSGASYTYTSATCRQARASAGNQIQILQSDSERSSFVDAYSAVATAGVTGAAGVPGIGVNSTTAFVAFQSATNAGAGGVGYSYRQHVPYKFSITGLCTISRNEAGDGANANTFNSQSQDYLLVQTWL